MLFCCSLSGATSCSLETDETEDIESSDAAEREFQLQQVLDEVDGDCMPGLTGLYNHGNTCYANAAIQALSNWYMLSRFHHFNAVYCLSTTKVQTLSKAVVHLSISLSRASGSKKVYLRTIVTVELCYKTPCWKLNPPRSMANRSRQMSLRPKTYVVSQKLSKIEPCS